MEERQSSTGIWLFVLVLAVVSVLSLRFELFQAQQEPIGFSFAPPVATLMATATPGLAVPTPRPYTPPPTSTAFVVVQDNSGSVTVNQSTTNVDVDLDFCFGYCP